MNIEHVVLKIYKRINNKSQDKVTYRLILQKDRKAEYLSCHYV